ncbi:MAG: Hsp20 family protein [Gammaproteobacteria bacterium]|nr:Hsp20 family protein [Gammaproteobacteria bacterium]
MNAFDFSPLFRTAIGFDRLASALESAHRADAGGYPPYNIELTGEDKYRITLAVAGFSADEIDIEVKENLLTVTGKKSSDVADRQFLHRGIANRNFERTYQLADYVRVEGADLQDGLLHVDLKREVPETMKPRRIEIRGQQERLIENPVEQETRVA